MAEHVPEPTRSREKRVPSNVYLPTTLRDELRAASERTGISQSRLVEDGVRMRLALLNGGAVVSANCTSRREQTYAQDSAEDANNK